MENIRNVINLANQSKKDSASEIITTIQRSFLLIDYPFKGW